MCKFLVKRVTNSFVYRNCTIEFVVNNFVYRDCTFVRSCPSCLRLCKFLVQCVTNNFVYGNYTIFGVRSILSKIMQVPCSVSQIILFTGTTLFVGSGQSCLNYAGSLFSVINLVHRN